MRSRSVKTSSSRIRRCTLASCHASAAWSANAAIMSSWSALKGCAPTRRSATSTPATASVARNGSTSAGPAPPASSRGPRPTLSNRPGVRRTNVSPIGVSATGMVCAAASEASPAVAATTSSATSLAASSGSTGTATSVTCAPLRSRALSAMSRNTRAGSVPDSSSVPMSRVASIQD